VFGGVTDLVPEVVVKLVQEAEQVVALVEDQVRIEEAPATIEVGLAVRVTVAAGGGGGGGGVPPTVTIAEAFPAAPAPVQVIEKVVVVVGVTD